MSDVHVSLKAIKIRLFLTCWLVFVLHFATDFVREHYLVLSIVDDFSFRLDKYVGLHNDIFETPNHGAHHGANPGASMIAAIPYIFFKPIVDGVVNYTKKVSLPEQKDTATYKDHRPARVRFYKKVREQGLDVKFGLVGFVTMAFCMSPLSALSVVVMYQVLGHLGLSNRLSLWMSLLYAFGTPIFFRTGYLNQNLMVGVFGFFAFILLWQLREDSRPACVAHVAAGRWKIWQRFGAAGFLGGLALLCDYSGVIVLFMLGGYGLLRRMDSVSFRHALKDSLWYIVGAIGPIILLLFYQWRSFGHPFYPGQHYMPSIQVIDIGYRGFGWPSGELLWMLLFDPRFGLFIASPILLLAFFAPILTRFRKNIVPMREMLFVLIFFMTFLLFFGGVQYTKLQWVTGIRYLVPVIPFIFLLTVAGLIRMPRIVAYVFAILAFAQSWSMSMVRSVGVPGEGVMNSITKVFLEGFQLPWLNTLYKMTSQYFPFLEGRGLSPLPLFVLWGFIIYGIWRIKSPWAKLRKEIVHTSEPQESF
ncbi:MAG: hypothetical protein ACE5HX_13740 [bacterium]